MTLSRRQLFQVLAAAPAVANAATLEPGPAALVHMHHWGFAHQGSFGVYTFAVPAGEQFRFWQETPEQVGALIADSLAAHNPATVRLELPRDTFARFDHGPTIADRISLAVVAELPSASIAVTRWAPASNRRRG